MKNEISQSAHLYTEVWRLLEDLAPLIAIAPEESRGLIERILLVLLELVRRIHEDAETLIEEREDTPVEYAYEI